MESRPGRHPRRCLGSRLPQSAGPLDSLCAPETAQNFGWTVFAVGDSVGFLRQSNGLKQLKAGLRHRQCIFKIRASRRSVFNLDDRAYGQGIVVKYPDCVTQLRSRETSPERSDNLGNGDRGKPSIWFAIGHQSCRPALRGDICDSHDSICRSLKVQEMWENVVS